MIEEWETINSGKKLKTIGIIILIIVGIMIAATISLNAGWIDTNTETTTNIIQEDESSKYTSVYFDINISEAQELINDSSINLTIVDISSCKCTYKKGHIPNAIWNRNPKYFYET